MTDTTIYKQLSSSPKRGMRKETVLFLKKYPAIAFSPAGFMKKMSEEGWGLIEREVLSDCYYRGYIAELNFHTLYHLMEKNQTPEDLVRKKIVLAELDIEKKYPLGLFFYPLERDVKTLCKIREQFEKEIKPHGNISSSIKKEVAKFFYRKYLAQKETRIVRAGFRQISTPEEVPLVIRNLPNVI